MIKLSFALGSMLSFVVASSASATVMLSVAPAGAPATGVSYAPLNSLPLGNAGGLTTTSGLTVTFTGSAAMVVTGSSALLYAAPIFSNGNGTAFGDANGVDTTKYIEVGGVGSAATLSFANTETFLGLLWGSVDAYNTVTLYSGVNGTGSVVATITGSQVVAAGAIANATSYIDITSTTPFQSFAATSSSPAFEFDDVSFGPNLTTVPEPISLVLLSSGLLGIAANSAPGAVCPEPRAYGTS